MKKWILKAIVQKVISFLPNSHRINFWFQKNITKGVHLSEEHFHDKLTHCSDHLCLYTNINKNINGKKIVEIGTGWYPVIPVGLFLCGAGKIDSYDITPLCNKERFLKTVEEFKKWGKQGSLDFYLPNIIEERWKKLISINEDYTFNQMLEAINIELFVSDLSVEQYFSTTIDLVISNNVLEHIYPKILKKIIHNCSQFLTSDGVQSHFIDMSDHFAHADEEITVYNYLKFSNAQWKLIDNSVQPQNRLRITDYVSLFRKIYSNVEIHRKRKGNINLLKSIKMDGSFKKHKFEDIAVTHAHLIIYN